MVLKDLFTYQKWIGQTRMHPSKIVDLGQEVDAMILEIDEERRRIFPWNKQCFSNPWSDFAAKKNKGDKVSGTIKSITDFGILVLKAV